MGRKISEQERLLAFALKATPAQLDNAIDTLQAVKRSRAPQKEKAPSKPKVAKAAAGGESTEGTAQ